MKKAYTFALAMAIMFPFGSVFDLADMSFSLLCSATAATSGPPPGKDPQAVHDTSEVNRLNSLSRKFATGGDYGKSILYADSAMVLAVRAGYEKGQADAYNNHGMCQFRQGNNPEALKNYALSLRIREQAGDKQGIASAYNNIGTVHGSQGNYPEALKNYSQALKIREATGDKQGMVSAFNNIGNIQRLLGNYADALRNYQAGLEIVEETGNKQRMAVFYNNIASIYNKQGNDPEAYKSYHAALTLSEEAGDKETTALCYHNIGRLYTAQGNYPEALKYYLTALKTREEIGAKQGIAHSQDNIGAIYAKQGNYKAALEMYQTALAIKEELGDREGIAHSTREIGMIMSAQGNHAGAMKNVAASLKISEEIGDKEAIAVASEDLGTIYMRMGNPADAQKHYLASVRISEEIGDQETMTTSYLGLGNLNIRLGNFPSARAYLGDALSLSKKTGNKSYLQGCYASLAKLDSAEGHYARALEHYKMSVLFRDSLFNEESDRQTALLKIRFETDKKDREIELLNKDKEINMLQLKQQQASLLASRLETVTRRDQLRLANNSLEIHQLKLAKAHEEIEHQQADAKAKKVDFELLDKDRKLKEQQIENQKTVRNGLIAGTALLVLVAFLIMRSMQLRKKLERQEAVASERKRISADLHDDIGTGLSRISLMSELVKNSAQTPEAKKEAEKISAASLELSLNISEIIWALNSNNDFLENLVAYVRRFAAEYFENSPVNLKITTPENIARTPISGENRRNIFYTVKEALHNILKHSEATEAELKFTVNDGVMSVIISDNGKGMPHGALNRFGNGMTNMRNRMKSIRGDLSIENHAGTKIILTIPV